MTAEALNALCRMKFDAFAERAFRIIEPGIPYEWNWHLGCISEHLTAVYEGEIKRIVINVPPRSLKSYLAAKSWPAWYMGKDPRTKFIVASYSAGVAEANALGCKRIMKDPWYQQCFPGTLIDPEMDRMDHFETTQRGQYYANSALSPMTGFGANVILIDDPIKPMEAVSDVVRASVNENIRTTLFSRFNNPKEGRMVMIMQRVHEDDPSGNLLKDGGWTHLKLPAEAKQSVHISLKDKTWDMEEGELLFPQRLSREILDKLILDMSEYHYVGQYLQEPVPLGGGEFKPQWVQSYPLNAIKPTEMNICILCDPSGGDEINKRKKKNSDWSAFMVVGLAPDQNRYLLDIVRDRLNPTERVEMLFILHRKWLAKAKKPIKVGYEKYGMMSDIHYIHQKQKEEGYRFPVIELGGSMNKEARIRRLIPDMQQGRWYFPENLLYTDSEGRTFDLVKELVESEMPNFPRARYDDMMDALARSYDEEMAMAFPQIKSRKSLSEMAGTKEAPQSVWDF